MSSENVIASIVHLNGGKVVGKTRLQKTVHLLESLGLDTDFHFEYHNFGPFSADVAEAADIAVVSGVLDVQQKFGHHEMPYSEYTSMISDDKAFLPGLPLNEATQYIMTMKKYNAVEMELASTLWFLLSERNFASEQESMSELKTLKPRKATEKRISRAASLLRELGLR